jgi:hypothetical protein
MSPATDLDSVGQCRLALEKWQTFRAEYERWAVSGMTVDERLHALGLLPELDRARRARDAVVARRILARAHVDEPLMEAVLQGL